MDPFAELQNEIGELVDNFMSAPAAGDLTVGVTQYSFWMLVSAVALVVLALVFKKKQKSPLAVCC